MSLSVYLRQAETTDDNVLKALDVPADSFQDILVVVVPGRGLVLAVVLLVGRKLGEERRVKHIGLCSELRQHSMQPQEGSGSNSPSSAR